MIVDRQGGPRHTPGGFAAPIVAEDDGRYTLTISYRYIREIAQAIKPNAVVLGTSTYSRDIEAVSARNAHGRPACGGCAVAGTHLEYSGVHGVIVDRRRTRVADMVAPPAQRPVAQPYRSLPSARRIGFGRAEADSIHCGLPADNDVHSPTRQCDGIAHGHRSFGGDGLLSVVCGMSQQERSRGGCPEGDGRP